MKTIPTEEVVTRVKNENSWWESPHEIPLRYRTLPQRPYFDLVFSYCTMWKPVRAFVLLGPRRVGKTVIIFQVIKKLISEGADPKTLCYIDVELPIYNGKSIEDLIQLVYESRGFGKEKELYLCFDEMQYMKEWEIQLKSAVDNHDNIKFIVSGSSAAALRMKSRESGAGRFTDFNLPPLTFYEYLILSDVNDLVTSSVNRETRKIVYGARDLPLLNEHFIKYINYGGYPEVLFSKEIQANPGQFIKSDIIDKVLLRDLPSLYGISDIQELNSLFNTLAYNSGNEVSLEALSMTSGVAKNTIRRYIEYLEAAFLIKRIERVDCNVKKFKRATTFKVYLTNPSMRCALFSPLSENDPALGDMVETAVFAQWFHLPSTNLHYARWGKGDGEVDIVSVNEQFKPNWAMEVKWSDAYEEDPTKLKSLIKFSKTHPNCKISVTTKTRTSIKPLHESCQIDFRPASIYCFILSRNLVQRRQLEAKSLLESAIDEE